jgi:dihydrofolate reductase
MPFWHDDLMKWQSGQLFASDALLLGRVTYEEFVASWPQRSGDPFSDKFNSYAEVRRVEDAEGAAPLELHAAPRDLVQAVESSRRRMAATF